MTWPTKPLGEVLEVDSRSVKPESISDETAYVGLESIGVGGYLDESVRVASGELKSSKFGFDSRHVLFGKLRPNLGKVARPVGSGVCSTDIFPLLPSELLDRNYLAHFLLLPSSIAKAASRTAGVNLPRINASVLKSFEIPLPPLPEQRRIASILDQADALRAKRRRALAAIAAAKGSIFTSMFPRDGGSASMKLGEIAAVRSGSTPDRSRPEYFGGAIPWVKTTEVQGDLIIATEESVTQEGQKAARLKLYPAGSIVIAMYGQGRTRGQSAILGIDATVNQACAVVLPGEQVCTAFLGHQLRMLYQQLRKKARGGNQANLNLGLVRDLDVMVPPLKAQQEFAKLALNLGRVREMHLQQLSQLDGLFASLQSRAFKDEL